MSWFRLIKSQVEVQEFPQGDIPQDTAAVILTDGVRVLLLKRGDTAPWMPGKWNLPGGMIEQGETPQSAAVRECQEETGITPSGLKMVTTIDVEGYPVHFFTATVPVNMKINRSYENSAEAWVSKSELVQYQCVPGVIEAINMVI